MSNGGVVGVNPHRAWNAAGREAKSPGILQMGNEIQWEKTKAWGVTVQLHTAWSSLTKAAQGPFTPLKLAGALSSRVKEPQRVRETGDPALIDAHMPHPTPCPLGCSAAL